MTRKQTVFTLSALLLSALAGAAFLGTRGIREQGTLCVTLTLDHPPGSSAPSNTDIPLKEGGRARITAVSGIPERGKFTVHADVHGTFKTTWSLKDGKPRTVLLTPKESIASALREAAQVPASAKSVLGPGAMLE